MPKHKPSSSSSAFPSLLPSAALPCEMLHKKGEESRPAHVCRASAAFALFGFRLFARKFFHYTNISSPILLTDTNPSQCALFLCRIGLFFLQLVTPK